MRVFNVGGVARATMHGFVTRPKYRWCLLVLVILCIAASAHPQAVSPISGRWVWKEIARKDQPQIRFTLVIRRQGNLLRGVYSVDEFVNGEWQGEDGNQTPFQGRVTGGKIRIEFDPSATVPGYEKNVNYKAPTDGRKASIAVLTFNDGKLLWHLVDGSRIEGLPDKLALSREVRPK